MIAGKERMVCGGENAGHAFAERRRVAENGHFNRGGVGERGGEQGEAGEEKGFHGRRMFFGYTG